MQIDQYTKAVLTVIATALVVIALRGAVPGARAGFGEVQQVQICDGAGHCADLSGTPSNLVPSVSFYCLDVATE
jgi:hypothetical protein